MKVVNYSSSTSAVDAELESAQERNKHIQKFIFECKDVLFSILCLFDVQEVEVKCFTDLCGVGLLD